MRFVFLFLAFGLPSFAGEIDWLSDKPATGGTRRATIEETSSTGSTTPAATIQAKKTATQGCLMCGDKCTCTACECTADYWKDWCKACPAAHKEAYIRSLATVRSVPQTNFQQGAEYLTTPRIPATGADARYLRSPGGNQAGSIFTGAPAEMFGNTRAYYPESYRFAHYGSGVTPAGAVYLPDGNFNGEYGSPVIGGGTSAGCASGG